MKGTLIIVALLFTHCAIGQIQPLISFNQSSNGGTLITMLDNNGVPFVPINNVQGNPFWQEEWTMVNLLLANGNVHRKVKARLNIYNNLFHFMNTKGVEMTLPAKDIGRIEMIDPLRGDTALQSFVTILDAAGSNKASLFYEVLAQGKITLLKQVRKKLQENRNDVSNETTRLFEQYETYYVFVNDALVPTKRGKSFYEPLMQGQWKTVEAYASNNNLGFKSYSDIAKLISYYNSL